MKSSHTAAAWLFECLGIDSALAGDLEECAREHSGVWYWRQVFTAMWTGTWDIILHHKLLSARAVATGSAVNFVWLLLWRSFVPYPGFPVTPVVSVRLIPYFAILLAAQLVTGWIVARTHRAHAVPMVMVFGIWLMAWFVGNGVVYVRGLLVYSDLIDRTGFPGIYVVLLAWYSLPEFAVITGLLFGGIMGALQVRAAGGLTPASMGGR